MTQRSITMHPLQSLLIITILLSVNVAVADDDPFEAQLRSGVIVFKISPEFQVTLQNDGTERFGLESVDRFMDEINATKVERTFPHCKSPIPNGTDLTRIYTLYFPISLSMEDVSRDMSRLPEIEYAEPWTIHRWFFEHNDPLRDEQWGLDICQANEAHDISTGDPSVAIGMMDMGIDMDHPDLAPDLWINPIEDLNGDGVIQNQEINGRDDDDNGYIDDFYGWDFHDRDNDPEDEARMMPGHGCHTSGIAAAATHNEEGVASVGFNCSIMVVRVGDDMGVQAGFEGIVYAVDAGAKVINCSWGAYRLAQREQDVINYAYENDALVICAAGNENTDSESYPACYEHAIAVAATDSDDRKWSESNYGEWVDVSAPGHEIINCFTDGDYFTASGTSMSSPFAASVALLIRAAFPDISVDRTVAMLLEGAENIDDMNDRYRGQLGAGRVNALRSLQLGPGPSLNIDSLNVIADDDGNGRMDPGETIEMCITISNDEQGDPAQNLVIRLTTDDPDLAFNRDEVQLQELQPGEIYTNDDNPFILEVSEETIGHTTWITADVVSDIIAANRTFEFVIGHPDVLIVDDDSDGESEKPYFEAIEELGHGWLRWETRVVDLPSVDLLTDHDFVIWETGNSDRPLDGDEWWQMEAALNQGANILLIGNRIGNDDDNHQFMRTIFGAQHEADSVNAVLVEGIRGNRPIEDDVQLILPGGEGNTARLSPSTMLPVNGADSLVVYTNNRDILGVAGVYRENEQNESRSVYLGFSFEAASDDLTRRHEFLGQLYRWFMGLPGAVEPIQDIEPRAFILDAAYPNPFNSTTRISFQLAEASPVRVTIIDLTGRVVATLAEREFQAGYHSLVWNADGVPSGDYFAKVKADGRSAVKAIALLR